MREKLLRGILEFPGTAILEKYPDQEEDILRFWKVLWFNHLNDHDTNGIHWYTVLGIKLYNDLIRRLSHHGWVTSHSLTGRKWISVELNEDKLLEIVSPDELQEVKARYKYKKYTLDFEESTQSDVVKQNGQLKQTGLIRDGFMDVGNTQFGYDMTALSKYSKAIKLNLTKSMDKVRGMYPEMKSSTSSYDSVSEGIFEYHLKHERKVFTTGNNVSDSRGRAISNCLSKVANPIGNKDFRAALVITYD